MNLTHQSQDQPLILSDRMSVPSLWQDSIENRAEDMIPRSLAVPASWALQAGERPLEMQQVAQPVCKSQSIVSTGEMELRCSENSRNNMFLVGVIYKASYH